MMDAGVVRFITLGELSDQTYTEHVLCPGKEQGIEGAFAIELDRYQLNELWCNSYTYAEATCLQCHGDESFVLRLRADSQQII